MDNMKPIGTQTYINGFMLYKSNDAIKTRIENQVHKNHTKIDLYNIAVAVGRLKHRPSFK